MTDAEVCMAAARLIEKRGLAKGTRMDFGGSVCIMGALNIASNGKAYCFGEDEPAKLIIPRVLGELGRVVGFNDSHDTTQDEVIALLESGAYSLVDGTHLGGCT